MNSLNTVPEMKQFIRDNKLKKKGMRLTMKKPEMIEGFKRLGLWIELSMPEVRAQRLQAKTFTMGEGLTMEELDILEELETTQAVEEGFVDVDFPSPTVITSAPAKPKVEEIDLFAPEPTTKESTVITPQGVKIIIDELDTSTFTVIQDGETYEVNDDGEVYNDDFDEVGKWDPISKTVKLKKRYRKKESGKSIQELIDDMNEVNVGLMFPEFIYQGVKYYKQDDEFSEILDLEYNRVGKWNGEEIVFDTGKLELAHMKKAGAIQ